MDATVRVWSVLTGECVFVLLGHTSLVGLLGLSPSYLVSAAADSTLRIWNLDSGELVHTLAAHTGAITCFVHDEFKVLSGSDGNLKMWDVREGGVVRDLLGGVQGVWQVVCEGRWCVAASNRGDRTVLDVWDFGRVEGEEDREGEGEGEGEDGWVGEVVGGVYDDDVFAAGEEEEEEVLFVAKTTKGKSKVEDDAMDLDGEDGVEDEEMSSPVQSRGASASASASVSQGSTEGSKRPGMFRFYGHIRHRPQVASTIGEPEPEEGEGEMQDMRVVEGLVSGSSSAGGGVSFEFGGAWEDRLGTSHPPPIHRPPGPGPTLRRVGAASISAAVLPSAGPSAQMNEGVPTGAIRSLPPTSGRDETPTRPRGGGGTGVGGMRGHGGRRK